MTASLPTAQLLVCIKCQGQAATSDGTAPAEGPEPRGGSLLYEQLRNGTIPEGIIVKPVECLSNCSRGCSVALRGEGRWTYVYGNLDAQTQAETVLDGAHRYQQTTDGLVPWRERSDHFRKNCIARIPPLTYDLED